MVAVDSQLLRTVLNWQFSVGGLVKSGVQPEHSEGLATKHTKCIPLTLFSISNHNKDTMYNIHIMHNLLSHFYPTSKTLHGSKLNFILHRRSLHVHQIELNAYISMNLLIEIGRNRFFLLNNNITQIS